MKKAIKKTFSIVSCFFLAIMMMLPVFSLPKTTALAQTEQEVFSLVPPTFNASAALTLQKYNISNTSSFTPFDFGAGKRFDGMSFSFNVDERNQIVNQYVLVDRVENLSKDVDYSLNIWVYFDNIYLHNFSIILELENQETIEWSLTQNQLFSLIRKTTEIDLAELPYGWNKIELPFYIAQKSGNIYEGDNISPISKVYFDFTSDTVLATGEFAKLRFFDLHVGESTDKNNYAVTKQNYRFASFNFFPEDVLNSLCVGDSLKIPLFSSVINYAWSGEMDLTRTGTFENLLWKITLQTPDTQNERVYPSFGDTISFDAEGTYQLSYQCIDTNVSQSSPIISGSITISVSKLNAIYFNRASSVNLEVGKTYVFNVSTSSIFSTTSEITLVSSSDKLVVDYKGNGVVEIRASESGSYSVTASVQATRPASPTLKEYTTTINITAKNLGGNNNFVLKIVLWGILGAFVLGFIILGLILLVKSKKNDVK